LTSVLVNLFFNRMSSISYQVLYSFTAKSWTSFFSRLYFSSTSLNVFIKNSISWPFCSYPFLDSSFFACISCLMCCILYAYSGIIARETLVSYSLKYLRKSNAFWSSSDIWLKYLNRFSRPTMMSNRKYCFLKLCILFDKIAFVVFVWEATVLSKARSTGRVISSSSRSLSSFSSPLFLK